MRTDIISSGEREKCANETRENTQIFGKGAGKGVDRSQRYMARSRFISSIIKRSFDRLVRGTDYGKAKAFSTVRLGGDYLYFTRPEIYQRQQVERELERAKLIGYLRR